MSKDIWGNKEHFIGKNGRNAGSDRFLCDIYNIREDITVIEQRHILHTFIIGKVRKE
ncbi:MAG: hypothetical protein J6K28_05515 [Alistipes sp.]|nr:hypothetical protein [Alistipes sp.]